MKEGDLVVVSDGNHRFRAIARVTGKYRFLKREFYEQMRPVEWLAVFEDSLPRETIYDKIFSQMTLYQLHQHNLKLDALRGLLAGKPDVPRNHVLIIDEINRGNIAKILGELITLLEPDKRLGAENELQVTLPYSGETLGVPANLYVVGTMNTADRSIAFLDVALRRRFQFVEMMPDPELIRLVNKEEGELDGIDVPELLQVINNRIEVLYDRDHLIGHSFFLKVESLAELRDVMRGKVIPLLQEYFYGDWSKVCQVLGCPFDENGKPANANIHPLISASLLNADQLVGGSENFVPSKVRCEVHRDFCRTSSPTLLRSFLEGVFTKTEVS
jgi:5-methylcytosine-specific restriction protein B